MSNVFVQVGIGFPLLLAFLLWVGRVRKVVAEPTVGSDVDTREECEWWNCGACASCDRAEQHRIDAENVRDRLRARGVEPTSQAVAAYHVAVAIADEIAEKQAQAEWEREKQDRDNERGGV
jgi:hypothetical protein